MVDDRRVRESRVLEDPVPLVDHVVSEFLDGGDTEAAGDLITPGLTMARLVGIRCVSEPAPSRASSLFRCIASHRPNTLKLLLLRLAERRHADDLLPVSKRGHLSSFKPAPTERCRRTHTEDAVCPRRILGLASRDLRL